MVQSVSVAQLTRKTILAGAVDGAADRGTLLGAVSGIRSSSLVIDFAGIDVVTSSYLISALSFLWEARPPLQPAPYAFANAEPAVQSELDYALSSVGVAAWLGTWNGALLTEIALVGRLEDSLALTMDWVRKLGLVTAPMLADRAGGVGPTGWNNRLTTLWQQGLLQRLRSGRLQSYRFFWQENNHGRELPQETN